MEKVSFNLFKALLGGVSRAGRSMARNAKRVGSDFITFKPAKKIYTMTPDKKEYLKFGEKIKDRFNLWDIAIPYKKSVLDHIARDGWKHTKNRYLKYMMKYPMRGTFKTAFGLAFPASLPVYLTALNAADDLTSDLNGKSEQASRDAGVRAGLGGRLAGGSVAGAIYAGVPQFLQEYLPKSIQSAGKAYNTINEYAPEQVSQAKNYFNQLWIDAAKKGVGSVIRSMNPIINYAPSNLYKTWDFLSDADTRMRNVSAYGVGAVSGKPGTASVDDYKTQDEINNRKKAQQAGVFNGIMDDYVAGEKDLAESAQDQLNMGINRDIFRTSGKKIDDVSRVNNSVKILQDENKSYDDKMKELYKLYSEYGSDINPYLRRH